MARILVIEDEPDIQQILEYNLREKGHKVFLAGKGEEGLRLAREKRPDLVLLDLMLPDMPGTEVCKILKSDPVTRNAQVVMTPRRARRSIGWSASSSAPTTTS